MAHKESGSLGETYWAWLTELMPAPLQAYLNQLVEDDEADEAVEHQVLNLVVNGYDVPVEIAHFKHAISENAHTAKPNILEQIARKKFDALEDTQYIGKPVQFSSNHFPGSPAVKIIEKNVENGQSAPYLGYRIFTEYFKPEDLPQIMQAIKDGSLTTSELANWQRPQFMPGSHLIKLPESITATLTSTIPYPHRQIEFNSPFYPKFLTIETTIRSNFSPEFKHFSFDARMRSTRRPSAWETADQMINLVLATQLIQNTRELQSTEDIYEYIEKQKLDLDFDALHDTLVNIVKRPKNSELHTEAQKIGELGIVDSTFSIQEHYTIITKWLVVCAQQLLLRSKPKELMLPFPYQETDVPLAFIPHALNSFLLFAHELPLFLNQIKNESGTKTFAWGKLVAAARHMVGDDPDPKRRTEDLIIGYSDRVILKKMNAIPAIDAIFELEFQEALRAYMARTEGISDGTYPKKGGVTLETAKDYFHLVPQKLERKMHSLRNSVQEAKKRIAQQITLYGRDPGRLAVGRPQNKQDQETMGEIAAHLTKHGLADEINQAGGLPRGSRWREFFREN